MEKEQDIDIEHFLTKKNKKCIKVINKFLNNKIKNEDKNRITLQVIEDLKSKDPQKKNDWKGAISTFFNCYS